MFARFLPCLAAAALLCGGPRLAAAPAQAKLPNIVIILADDLGYGDVGFNGGKEIPTPNLNRIAAGGTVFTHGYAAHQISSPSRAGILTGRYPQRYGLERSLAWRPQDASVGLPAAEKTLAELLGPKGYKSALIGKWHLGAHDAFHPNNRGFDEFFGFLGSGHRYFPGDLNIQHTFEARNEPESFRTWILRGMQPVRTQRYLTEEFTAEAVDFVRRHRDDPFLLVLSHQAPRAPLQAPEQDIAAFSHIQNERRRTYAAMISVMDRGIGLLLDTLDLLEIADNTLLFFVGTSGGDTQNGGASNGGLRGQRAESYEGGLRVPFVARWPGVIPGGAVYPKPVSALDVFTTSLVAAGLSPDSARPLDGVNLVPFVRGENSGAPHERIYFRVFDSQIFALREGPFKLIKTRNAQTPALFNLHKDPSEKNNIAEANPDRVRSMEASLAEWNTQMIDPVFPGVDMREWKQGGARN